MSRRAFQEIHDLNRAIGRDEQMPLARTVSKATAQPASARLELLRADRTSPAGRQSETHFVLRRLTSIIQPVDHNLGFGVRWVDEAQPADLRAIVPWIEYGHVVAHRLALRDEVVHARHEAVRRPNVGERLDVQGGDELKAPIAVAVADPARQALVRAARFQLVGIDSHARPGGHAERDGAEALTGIVDGVNLHRSAVTRVIDDSDEALLNWVGCRHDQRQGMLGP